MRKRRGRYGRRGKKRRGKKRSIRRVSVSRGGYRL